ncbi:MAG: hypothetical protein WEA99_12575 [Brumimicrobium sp.]
MITKKIELRKISLIATLVYSTVSLAQQPDLQFYRPNNKEGLNVFESTKKDTVDYDGVKVRVGGDFAMQFQGLSQSNEAGNLVELGNNFNLPTANFNIDAQLMDGLKLHMRTYMSSRHHVEAWIKGGNIQIDKLDFIKPGFMENIMDFTTVRIGLDELDYGDAHYRRTDNARGIFNPFVGNYIMDAFTTEVFGEVTLQKNGLLGVLGVSNGKLNQNVVVDDNTYNKPSFYGKLGYDKKFGDDFRARLTGSWYINTGTSTGTWMYGGDRAGARYYNILETTDGDGGDFDGRYNARFTKITAFQVNPFIKYKGFELFGIYEIADGHAEFTNPEDTEGAMTQIAAELIYRFGKKEQFYVAGRYNEVSGKMRESATETLNVSRINAGAGWYLTNNVLVKLEYMNQDYNGDAWGGRFAGANFNGLVGEAVISF